MNQPYDGYCTPQEKHWRRGQSEDESYNWSVLFEFHNDAEAIIRAAVMAAMKRGQSSQEMLIWFSEGIVETMIGDPSNKSASIASNKLDESYYPNVKEIVISEIGKFHAYKESK